MKSAAAIIHKTKGGDISRIFAGTEEKFNNADSFIAEVAGSWLQYWHFV